jgi:hypothetical protein
MALDYVSSFLNYANGGALHAIGAQPIGKGLIGPVGATDIWRLAGGQLELRAGQKALFGNVARSGIAGAVGAGMLAYATGDDVGTAAVAGGFMTAMITSKPELLIGGKAAGAAKGMGRFLEPGLTVGMSGYFVYKGYQDNGIQGARDAAVWDIAVNSAVAKFGYKAAGYPEAAIMASRGAIVSKGFISHSARFLGAGVGAQIGQAIGDSIGIPGGSIAGAFAGAYVGAAPLRFVASHPIISAGAVVAGGMAAAGYGAYEVMKMGYAQKQSRRGIQTSGDLAAFMTTGAQTMRARSVQAIQKSHMNARSALGQEANFMHYPSKNYFSQYRQ